LSTAILRGGRLVYEPRALCWHEHRKDGDALRGQAFGYGVGFSAIVTKALTGAELLGDVLDGATFKDGMKVNDDETTTTDERVAA
jgi:hypothetical protein